MRPPAYSARSVAKLGLAVAVAFVLSYLEVILPLPVGIPGVKVGLCHIVVVYALYRMRLWETLMITCVRVVLAGVLFGSVASMMYSLAGAVTSLAVMRLLRQVNRWSSASKPLFSPVGISIAGAVTHNMAQMICAAILMGTSRLVWYLPVLLLSGCLSGIVIGWIAAFMLSRTHKM